MDREQVIRMEQLCNELRDLISEIDDDRRGPLKEKAHKEPQWLFVEVELGGEERKVEILRSLVYQFHNETKKLREELKAADERLKIVKAQRDELDRQVEDHISTLSIRDDELTEARRELAEAKKVFAEVKEKNARQNHAIDLALVEIENIPDKSTKEHFRKCIIHIQNVLGPLVKKK